MMDWYSYYDTYDVPEDSAFTSVCAYNELANSLAAADANARADALDTLEACYA